MSRRRTRLAGLVVVLVLLAGCTSIGVPFDGVVGEGDTGRESRSIEAFARIEARGGIQVEVTVGGELTLEVEAQTNLLPIIVTEVEGDTLHLRARDSYSATRPIRITISTPSLAGIAMSGGTRGDISGLAESAFDADVDGGAELSADGAVHDLELRVNGGAEAHLDALDVAAAVVTITGGARAELTVSDQVTGEVRGGAHLAVDGPGWVDVESSGGAEVVTP